MSIGVSSEGPSAETPLSTCGVSDDGAGSVTARSLSDTWTVFGRPTQRDKVEFIAQILILYFIIVFSVVQIAQGSKELNLWTVLLSSSLGYILPSPSLKQRKKKENEQ